MGTLAAAGGSGKAAGAGGRPHVPARPLQGIMPQRTPGVRRAPAAAPPHCVRSWVGSRGAVGSTAAARPIGVVALLRACTLCRPHRRHGIIVQLIRSVCHFWAFEMVHSREAPTQVRSCRVQRSSIRRPGSAFWLATLCWSLGLTAPCLSLQDPGSSGGEAAAVRGGRRGRRGCSPPGDGAPSVAGQGAGPRPRCAGGRGTQLLCSSLLAPALCLAVSRHLCVFLPSRRNCPGVRLVPTLVTAIQPSVLMKRYRLLSTYCRC